MGQLGVKDRDAALEFALHARAIDDLSGFRHELVPDLRRLIDCDTIGLNEIDLERGLAYMVTDAPTFEGIERRFLELAHQHPMVPHQRRGDLRVYMISDFLSAREFHRRELYHDIYRRLEVEDQLAFGLSHETIVAINLGRRRRTFTERDRELLELVRPHLALAYNHARAHQRLAALIEALESGLEEHSAGIIRLDARDRIAHATAAARELLDYYFHPSTTELHLLPTDLGRWLAAAKRNGSEDEYRIAAARGRLRVREQPPAGDDCKWRTLILTEHRPTPPRLESLRSRGLSHRQAQVLRLVACGKTSRQIAAELQIKTATVEKHLEHIYRRLGVKSRAQAIARVLGGTDPE